MQQCEHSTLYEYSIFHKFQVELKQTNSQCSSSLLVGERELSQNPMLTSWTGWTGLIRTWKEPPLASDRYSDFRVAYRLQSFD